MKILVIGANGFLGRAIISRIDTEINEVIGLVRNLNDSFLGNCKLIEIDDLNGYSFLKDIYFDVILNVSMKRSVGLDERLTMDLNFNKPFNIISDLANSNTLVLNASTYIQNFGGIEGVAKESYGQAKNLLSSGLEKEAKLGKFRVLDLFLFTLYGPGDSPGRLIPLLLREGFVGNRISLTEGNQLMNLLYVNDAVDLFLDAFKYSEIGYSKFYLWEDSYLTLREIVGTIETVLGFEIPVDWGRKPYSGHEMFSPWEIPMKQFPNFETKTNLLSGITKILNCS